MTVPITVLMSVYNGQDYIAQAIQSVLAQTFSNFEFLIIDDGSTDNTQSIILNYLRSDNRICYLKKENSGLAESLNFGILHAKGQWIARIDADDICLASRLECQYNFALLNPKVVLIGSSSLFIEDDHFISIYNYPSFHLTLFQSLITGGAFFSHSSAFFKRSACLQVGGYNYLFKRSQDKDLWLKLTSIGQISSIKHPLVAIRLHQNQISHLNDGYTSFLYAYAALICFWLRKAKFCDPSLQKDSFTRFLKWLDSILLDSPLYFAYKIPGEIKNSFGNKKNFFLLGAASILSQLLLHPAGFFVYLCTKILKINFPWIFAWFWRFKIFREMPK